MVTENNIMKISTMKEVMKKHVLALIAIVTLVFLAGCSETDEAYDTNEDTTEEGSNIISGTASFDISEVDNMFNAAPETRTTVHYNKNKRLDFRWKTGERIPMFLLFKQDNKTLVIKNMVLVEDYNKATFDASIPGSFDRRKGNLYIAAVMGKQPGVKNGAWASHMTSTGKFKIETSNITDAASEEFNLPFYAPLSLVKPTGKITLDFKALGSWFAVKMDVKHDINPDRLLVNSDVVSTNGTLDLFSSNNNKPAWSPDPSTSENIQFDVKNFEVKANRDNKPLVVWFMPLLDKKAQKPTTLTVEEVAKNGHGPKRYTRDTNGKNVNFANNVTYTLNIVDKPSENNPDLSNGLVISLFHTTLPNTGNRYLLQISNISNHAIDLSGYYLVRSVYGSPEKASGVLDLGSLESAGAKFLYNDREKKILPTGASILITSYNNTIANRTFDGCKNDIYQIALLGDNDNLRQQFEPEKTVCRDIPSRYFSNAYFLTYNGTNISLSKPNDIVDNFGRDAYGRIYRFENLNLTYYRVPYFNIWTNVPGPAGPATYVYNPKTVMRYEGTRQGGREVFEDVAWKYDNETMITSLGCWGKYGSHNLKKNNMYPKRVRR